MKHRKTILWIVLILILLAAFVAVGYLFFGLDRLGKKKALQTK